MPRTDDPPLHPNAIHMLTAAELEALGLPVVDPDRGPNRRDQRV